MKLITLSLSAVAVAFSCNSIAQDSSSISDKIFSRVPTISQFERYCLVSSEQGELEKCLESIPYTQLNKRLIFESRRRIDTLNELAFEIDGSDDLLDPMEKFCLFTSKPECLGHCLDGTVCP